MGNRKISVDVKLAAIHLYEQGILELHEILNCIGFSRRTFYRIKRLYDETGHVIKPRSEFLGRPHILNLEDLHYLLELVHHRPDYFLDKLTNLMESNCFISVHYTTIHRELVRAGVSLKKLRKIAKERNEDLRADFKRRMAQYLPHELMFIDETSKDERTQCRRWGRAKKSCRACMRGPFVRGRRFTVVAALTLDGVVAGHVVEGSLRRNGYLHFLEHSVVNLAYFQSLLFITLTFLLQLPHCEAYPGKNSVLVMDNA
jgi:transposase